LPMVEFAQSVPNLTEASTNLYELVKGRNLVVYPDDDLRRAMHQAVALETSRGWRIAKEKAAHKIDVVVALAQAALGSVKRQQMPGAGWLEFARQRLESGKAERLAREAAAALSCGTQVRVSHLCDRCLKTWSEPDGPAANQIFHATCPKC